jgi:multiple sugar transport system permease protein
VPFYYALTNSVKSSEELLRSPPTLLPETFTLAWYQAFLANGGFQWAANTAVYAGLSTLFVCFGSAAFGFIVSRDRSRLGNLLYALVVASMMIPSLTYVVGLFNTFVFYEHAGPVRLIGTWWGLLAPASMSGFGVFLIGQAMRSFPNDVLDAARLDGASTARVFTSVVLPLLTPQLIALGLISFLAAYGDVLWPLVMASGPSQYTLSVGLATFASPHFADFGTAAAGAVLAALPAIIAVALFGRYLVSSLGFQPAGR